MSHQTTEAFFNGEPFRSKTARVEVTGDGGTVMYYYSQIIAWRKNDEDCFWIVMLGDALENILRKLNDLPGVSIKRRNSGLIYLNGKFWDGSEIKINL